MANAVPFTLITPVEVKFDGEAELVIVVTTEGEEGFLPSHAPFLAALKAGAKTEVDVKQTDSDLAAAREAHSAAGSDATAAAREQAKIDFAVAKLKVAGTT